VEEEEAQRSVKALNKMMHLFGVFTVGDVIPCLKWFDFGSHVKMMNETSKDLDEIIGELLKERRHKRTLGEKVDGQDQDIMGALLSLLDGTTIEGLIVIP
ncbi:cytochrome P450, partial [Trifolium medium]|nr:cytochrome P450 [Trifolium medium]